MNFGFLLHHNGNKADREEVKNIIQLDNNIEEAKTKLNNLIQISDTQKNNFNDDKTIELDNSSLHHALDHIQYADTQPHQKDATIIALTEEEDE